MRKRKGKGERDTAREGGSKKGKDREGEGTEL